MGNSILAGTLNFNPILQLLALAQEKPSSPPAQPSPAPVPMAFGVVIGSWLTVGISWLRSWYCISNNHRNRTKITRRNMSSEKKQDEQKDKHEHEKPPHPQHPPGPHKPTKAPHDRPVGQC